MARKPKLKAYDNPGERCANCAIPKGQLLGFIYDFSNCPHQEIVEEQWEIMISDTPLWEKEKAEQWANSHGCSHFKAQNDDD